MLDFGGRGNVPSPIAPPSGRCVRCAGPRRGTVASSATLVSSTSGTSVTGSSAASKTRGGRPRAHPPLAPSPAAAPGDIAPHVGAVRTTSAGRAAHGPAGGRRPWQRESCGPGAPRPAARSPSSRPRLVPLDGRDPEYFHLGARQREHDRDHVVVAGVAVDQNRDRHRRAVVAGLPARRGRPFTASLVPRSRLAPAEPPRLPG